MTTPRGDQDFPGGPGDPSEGTESEAEFWSAISGEFDPQVAEEHASRITATWELGNSGEHAAMRPAAGLRDGDDPGAWSGEKPTERLVVIAAPVVRVDDVVEDKEENVEEPAAEASAPEDDAPELEVELPPKVKPTIDPPVTVEISKSLLLEAHQVAALKRQHAPNIELSKSFLIEAEQAAAMRAQIAKARQQKAAPAPAKAAAKTRPLAKAAPLGSAPGRPKPAARPAAKRPNDVVLPSSSGSKLLVYGGLAALVLVGVVAGVVVFGGKDEPARVVAEHSTRNRTQIAAPAPPAPVPTKLTTAPPREPVRPAPIAPEPPPTPAVVTPPPAPTPAVAARPPTPAPAPAATVHLRVRTEPGDATLLVNGVVVTNPYDAELPQGSRHRVSARARGHDNTAQWVTLASTQDLVLRLTQRGAASSSPEEGEAAPRRPRASREGEGSFSTDNPY